MLTGIPKFVLVAGYKEGIFFNEFVKIDSISGISIKEMKKSGYVTEELTINLAEKAGFNLSNKSEINANVKDTKDHPNGVWTLPPSLYLKDGDKQKYQQIGESDRMTLLFKKPI